MATDYYSLEVRTVCAGFPMANVFNYKLVDSVVSNEFEVAASIINELFVGPGITSWMQRFIRLMAEDCYVSNILCKRFKILGGNTAEMILQETDYVGILTGVTAATQVAGCIIWVQDTVDTITGRNFIPGVPTDYLDDGRFVSAYQDNIDLFVTKHVSGFTVAGGFCQPVIYNRVGAIGYDITAGYLSPKVGTIRNREKPL